VVFLREGRKVRLKVKEKVLEVINKIASDEESGKESLKLLEKPVSELFEVEK
jgi:predicted DNA-binding antitoxin AbrB/MazE fold protein